MKHRAGVDAWLWPVFEERCLRTAAVTGPYREYGSSGGTEFDIDLSSDLMRLTTGGNASTDCRRVASSIDDATCEYSLPPAASFT